MMAGKRPPGLRKVSTPVRERLPGRGAALPEPAAALRGGLRTEALVEAELLFLRSLRLWASGPDLWPRVWSEHAGRFGTSRGREMLRAFVAVFDLLRDSARERLCLHHPGCPLVSPAEAGLLTLIGAGDPGFAAVELVGPLRARCLLEASGALRARYAEEGLSAPARPPSGAPEGERLH